MLVKVNQRVYLNTDNISAVILDHDKNQACVFTVDVPTSYDISLDAAAYLMERMNVQSAIIFPGEPGYVDPSAPSTQPLTSRIAQLLRDELVGGATLTDFYRLHHASATEIVDALCSLTREGVIVTTDATEDKQPRYYHVTHKPSAPNNLYEPLDPLPFRQMIREGKLQCVECKHQGCNDCADNNACCRCNCPSFTAPASEILPTGEQYATEVAHILTSAFDPNDPLNLSDMTTKEKEQYGQDWLIRQTERMLEFLKRDTTPTRDPLVVTEASASHPEVGNEKKADLTS